MLLNSVTSKLDRGLCCIGAFLDLAKAFDTVSIPILLQKLENVGIRGTTLDWFTSYLTKRQQIVRIGNNHSDPLETNYGVPQGSTLGPTLFLLYINDISTSISPRHDAEIVCYADDTAILFSDKTWDSTYSKAVDGLSEMAEWLGKNLLTLNTTKTKYLSFHKTIASQPKTNLNIQIHTCDRSSLACQCDYIERATEIKYLDESHTPAPQAPSRSSAAAATIWGSQDVYVKKGSTISLTCSVNVHSSPPSSASVLWYHGSSVVDFDSPRGGISLETEKTEGGTTSKLLVTKAALTDSGNYTCVPNNAHPASVSVHVLNGEHPAAMQTSNRGVTSRLPPLSAALLTYLLSAFVCR
ncbi:unnamed protein product [Plutella xylostella]|uniref:(diamondback moth) hypothetical protein n=1 Tax=Plutella xylostella TaxID=51655 RepID=A0A8S4G3S6_PLUXY|nr:unnamed protein product [Plutella xylostella]